MILWALLVLAACCTVAPAGAFTAKTLDITVNENTDATIAFDYELTWFENVAVFMHIADPGTELKKALEDNFNKPVLMIKTDTGGSRFTIRRFAAKEDKNDNVTLITPALSFAKAGEQLNKYWFAPLISPDFSPAVTSVNFPDGHSEKYLEQISIPAIRHTLAA